MPEILQDNYHEFQDASWIVIGTMLMQAKHFSRTLLMHVCYCKSSNFDLRKDFVIMSAGHLLYKLIFTQFSLV